MRVGEAIGGFFTGVVGVALSCGLSQVYGIIKGAVEGVRLAVCKYELRQVDKELAQSTERARQAAQQTFPSCHGVGGADLSQRSIAPRSDIRPLPSPLASSHVPQLASQQTPAPQALSAPPQETERFAADLQAQLQARRANLIAQIDQRKGGLAQAGYAMIPLVGAFVANAHAGHGFAAMASVLEDIAREVPAAARNMFFPGANFARSRFIKAKWEQTLDAKQVYIDVPYRDDSGVLKTRKIEAMVLPGKPPEGGNANPDAPTVVLSHGSGMTLYSMFKKAKAYQAQGYNVVVPTMGGSQYTQNNPPHDANNTVRTSELTIYQDVDGIMEYLRARGVQDVRWHGLSIGGVAAFQAALKYGAESPERVKDPSSGNNYPTVTHIVADQTLTNAGDVSANTASNVLGLRSAGRAVGQGAAPAGLSDGSHTTDGLDNLRKARVLSRSKVKLLVVEAEQDKLMGKKPKPDGNYEDNFARDLRNARYTSSDDQQGRVVILPGVGHLCEFMSVPGGEVYEASVMVFMKPEKRET